MSGRADVERAADHRRARHRHRPSDVNEGVAGRGCAARKAEAEDCIRGAEDVIGGSHRVVSSAPRSAGRIRGTAGRRARRLSRAGRH